MSLLFNCINLLKFFTLQDDDVDEWERDEIILSGEAPCTSDDEDECDLAGVGSGIIFLTILLLLLVTFTRETS